MDRILTGGLPGGLRVVEEPRGTNAGQAFRAEGPDGQIQVALRILRPEGHGADPTVGSDDVARLREQARRATRIRHPNVAAVYAIGETEEGWPYLVLESLDGELLSGILASSGPLPEQEAMDYFRQIAAGLRAAHEAGIVHGNLSPHSILVTRTAEGRPLVKLINFELAALPGHAPEPPGHRKAMAEYASPERLAGHEPDARSDVFSLAAVLHHLLTGAPPRAAAGAPIPKPARAVLAQALASAPGERFQTVSDFKRALWLATARPGRSVVTARAGRSGATARRLILIGGSGTALGVVIAVGLSLWLNPAGERSGGDAESGARVPAAIEVPENSETSSGLPDAGRLEPDEAAPDSVPKPAPSRRARRPAPPPPEPEPDVAAGYAPEPPPALLPAPPAPIDSLPVVGPSVAERPRPVEAEAIDVETQARAEASRVVTRYARALETRDVVALSQAYPGLTAEQRDAWELFFKVARDLDVTLKIEQFSLADSLMQLGVQGEYQYWNRSLNRAERSPVSLSATLRRSGQGWRLAAVQ